MKKLFLILFLVFFIVSPSFSNPPTINNKTVYSILKDSSGNPVGVILNPETGNYELAVNFDGHLDTNNATVTPLGIGGVYTGSQTDIRGYAGIGINVLSDVGSADMGLVAQYSKDGIVWFNGEEYTVEAGTQKFFTPPAGQGIYFRVKYTNGAVGQASFDLFTILKKTPFKWSSHNISSAISSNDDAILVKNVNTGEDPDGIFRNVKVSRDGNLTISDNSSGLAIAQENVTGVTFIHKFGNAPDFDTGDGIITVWDGSEDNTVWEKFQYNYSSSADIDSLSSSDNGDTQDIEILGLDSNYDLVTQTISLTGQTPASLSTNLIRVFRLVNINSSDNAGHVFCYVSGGTVTLGVPQTAADIRAIIQPLNNQTLMAVYTIPNGKKGYMRDWFAATAGSNKTSNYVVDLRARPFGGVFQLKHRTSISDSGSSYIKHNYIEPEVFAAKTDIEMRVSATAVGVTSASISSGFDIVLIDD